MLEERLKELVDYLKLRGLDVTEADKDYFKGIIRLAMNDGYKKAISYDNEQ